MSSVGELVHRVGEPDIEIGQPARVVGRKRDIDLVVDVEPFGMVIELFGHEGGPRHEAERLIEILELEPLRDRVAVLYLAPTAELRKGCGASVAAEFLSHRYCSWRSILPGLPARRHS